jgi:hypothetical protein
LPRSALNTARRPSGEIANACLTGRTETFEPVTWSAGRTLISSLETNGLTGGVRPRSQPLAPPSTREASSQGSIRERAAAVPVGRGEPAGEAAIDGLSLNRNCATAMSATRALRSFSRHRWINATTAAGVSPGSAFQSGVDFTIAAIVSVTSSPGKARAPVSIS